MSYKYRNLSENIHPGDLNQRVTFGRTVNTINANGFPEAEDQTICTVWAKVDDAGYTTGEAAEGANVERQLNVMIRHRDDVGIGDWLDFDSIRWTIFAIDNFSFKKNYLGMKAHKEQVTSG